MDSQTRLRAQLIDALSSRLTSGKPAAIPEAGRLVWGFFCELSAQRSYHFAGPNPISFAEIEAWARLNRWPLRTEHIELLRAMDTAWLAAAHTRKQDNETQPIPSNAPRQQMTAEIFDVVFG